MTLEPAKCNIRGLAACAAQRPQLAQDETRTPTPLKLGAPDSCG